MTNTDISIRVLRQEDGPGISALLGQSADTGRLQIAPRYVVDPYLAIIGTRPNVYGYIASHADKGIVGVVFLQQHTVRVESVSREAMFGFGLAVHPDFRRQGIGVALAEAAVADARARLPSDGIIYGSIQSQNAASLAVVQRWTIVASPRLAAVLGRIRRQLPRSLPGISVREVQPDDLPHVADSLNRFYADYNFYRPHSAERLANWLQQSPFDTPYRHYYVAVDSQGELLAGLAVTADYRVRMMHITGLPRSLALLNKVVRIIPSDNIVRPVTVGKLWWQEGRIQAARYLWQTVQAQWHQSAQAFYAFYDPRSRIGSVLTTPSWLPRGHLTKLMLGEYNLSQDRLVAE